MPVRNRERQREREREKQRERKRELRMSKETTRTITWTILTADIPMRTRRTRYAIKGQLDTYKTKRDKGTTLCASAIDNLTIVPERHHIFNHITPHDRLHLNTVIRRDPVTHL